VEEKLLAEEYCCDLATVEKELVAKGFSWYLATLEED
jgi:hypothetical protein